MICPQCGMPDMRERLRVTGIEHRAVYYIDWACMDCGYVDVDRKGGI